MDSPLRSKPLYCREWVIQKLLYIATSRQQHNWSKKNGVIILGNSGCGKTALLSEISWPTSNHAKQHSLSRRILARHFCSANFWHSLSLATFVSNLLKQLKCTPLLPEFKALLRDFPKECYSFSAICEDPDEVLRSVILCILNSLNSQGHIFFIVVDSIDENRELQQVAGERTGGSSKNIADLLLNNLEHFPSWLCLLCSARRTDNSFIQKFAGFRKIILDDQEKRKQYVQKDIKGYVCNRIEGDNKLKVLFSDSENGDLNSELLELLENKSDRCILYLEWVLDGVQRGLIKFSEIKQIPGTLRGLFLWYCQHLFEKKTFSLVRPILNVLLSSRNSITETDLIDFLWSRNLQIEQEELLSRLKLIERFLVFLPDGSFRIFHNSFSEWLLDVKYCTRHFLCDISQGHATLALSATCNLDDKYVDEDYVKDFAYDLSKSVACHKLSSELCAMWMAWSNINVREIISISKTDQKNLNSTKTDSSRNSVTMFNILHAGGAYRDGSDYGGSMIQSCDTFSNTNASCDSNHRHFNRTLSSNDIIYAGGSDANISSSRTSVDHVSVAATTDSKETESEHAVRVMLDNNPSCITEHDSDGLTPLAKAVQRGSLKCVKVLVKAGAAVDAENVNRQTALGLAAAAGHSSVVQFLLENGANPNHVDSENWTPLRSAAQNGHHVIINSLIKFGAQIDACDASGKTALRLAAFSGSTQCVEKLILGGANVNLEDKLGRTALIAACYGAHVDIVKKLLDAGACIDHTESAGHTALVFAFLNSQIEQSKHSQTVSLLLSEGAIVDYVNSDGMSPLGIAASQGHNRIVELLLSKGNANVEYSDSLGRTALYHAVYSGQTDTVIALIKWGAQQDVIDQEGRSLLSLACLQGHVQVARVLIDNNLDENHKDDNGCTPLHIAASEGTVELCHILIHSGSRLTEMDNDGKTALIYAAESGCLSVVKYLVEECQTDYNHCAHNGLDAMRFAALEERIPVVDYFITRLGCDIDARDGEGRTVLYFLAQDNKISMVKHLLEDGRFRNSSSSAPLINVNSIDNNGRSALIVAAWVGHVDMCQLLLENGADCYQSDNEGLTALLMAAWENRKDVVQLLLNYGADIEHSCNQGATALVIAVQEGHIDTVKYLLHRQANPHHEDEHGRNPMRIAAKNSHNEIIQLLEAYGSLPAMTDQTYSPTKRNSDSAAGPKKQSTKTSSSSATPPALPSRASLNNESSQPRPVSGSRFITTSLSSNKNTMRSEHRQSAALSISSDHHFSCQSLSGAGVPQTSGGSGAAGPNSANGPGGFNDHIMSSSMNPNTSQMNQSNTDPNISVSSSSANSSLDKRGSVTHHALILHNEGSLDSRHGAPVGQPGFLGPQSDMRRQCDPNLDIYDEQIYNHYDEPCNVDVEHTNTIGYNNSHFKSSNTTPSHVVDQNIHSASYPNFNHNHALMINISPEQETANCGPPSVLRNHSSPDNFFIGATGGGEHISEDFNQRINFANQNSCGANMPPYTGGVPQQVLMQHSNQGGNATEYLQMSILEQAWKQEQESRQKQKEKKQRRLSVFDKISKVFKLSNASGCNSKYKHPLFNNDITSIYGGQSSLDGSSLASGGGSNFNNTGNLYDERNNRFSYASQNSPHYYSCAADANSPLSSAVAPSFFPPQDYHQQAGNVQVQVNHSHQKSNYSISSQQSCGGMINNSGPNANELNYPNAENNSSLLQMQPCQRVDPKQTMSPVSAHMGNSRKISPNYQQFSPQPQHKATPAAAASASSVKKSDYMRLVDLTHLQSMDHQSQMSNRIVNYERKPQLQSPHVSNQNRKSSLDSQLAPPQNQSTNSSNMQHHTSINMAASEQSYSSQINKNPPPLPPSVVDSSSVDSTVQPSSQSRLVPVYVTTPSIHLPRRPAPAPPTEPQLNYQKRAPPPLPRKPMSNANLFLHTGGLSKAVPDIVTTSPNKGGPNANNSAQSGSQMQQQGNLRGSNYINHGEAAKRAALCRKPKLETIVEPDGSLTNDLTKIASRSSVASAATASPAISSHRRMKVETVI